MDLNNLYSEILLEQSRNTKNKHELENANIKELGHNPSCGDEITLYVDVKDDKINDISFIGNGCAISQASTSLMIDEIKGKTVDEVINLANKFISMVRGDLGENDNLSDLGDAAIFENIKNMPARVKCAVLSWYTIKKALENIENKKD